MDRTGLVIINVIYAVYMMVITSVTAGGGIHWFGWIFAATIASVVSVGLQFMLLFYSDFKVVRHNSDEVLDVRKKVANFIDTMLCIPTEDENLQQFVTDAVTVTTLSNKKIEPIAEDEFDGKVSDG